MQPALERQHPRRLDPSQPILSLASLFFRDRGNCFHSALFLASHAAPLRPKRKQSTPSLPIVLQALSLDFRYLAEVGNNAVGLKGPKTPTPCLDPICRDLNLALPMLCRPLEHGRSVMGFLQLLGLTRNQRDGRLSRATRSFQTIADSSQQPYSLNRRSARHCWARTASNRRRGGSVNQIRRRGTTLPQERACLVIASAEKMPAWCVGSRDPVACFVPGRGCHSPVQRTFA